MIMRALSRGLLIALVLAMVCWFGYRFVTNVHADRYIVERCFDNEGRWYSR